MEQLLKVKEKELANSNLVIEKYKKEKNELRKKLDDNININEINYLNDQIKIAQEKVDELEDEKKYLYKVKEEHSKCQEEQNKIIKEINNIKEELKKIKQENKNKSKTERVNLGIYFPNKNRGLSEEQIQTKKEQKIKKSLDQFWKINQEKLLSLSSNNNNNDMNNNNNNEIKNDNNVNTNTNTLSNVSKNITSLFKKKKKFGEELRNRNLDISNSNELPIIPLFNNSEKKILLNILPEKEIEKFEKRYECIDKEKNNLQRKLAFETKNLNKENKELENQYEYSNNQLKENEEKNKLLVLRIDDQQKELNKLQEKLDKIIKNVEDKKKKIKEKDEENKTLVKQLQELKINMKKTLKKIMK